MADHSLALSALRVAVYAPRDDEMRALARELAAARRANSDLQDHIQWIEARHDAYIVALMEDNAELEQQLEIARANSFYTNSLRFNREVCLAHEGDRLVRGAAQGRVEEDMPIEILRAVRLMRQDDDDEADEAGEVDESDDDAEMAVESTAAVP
jgi:hypothetical protein